MNTDYFEQLSQIASEMNRTRPMADAEVGYDVITDALVWSDEYPQSAAEQGRIADFECIRLVLRYRTTLLFGTPDEFCKPYWDKAMGLFPDWAGFCPARLKSTEELRKFYESRHKRDLRLLDRLDARCGLNEGRERVNPT